jgi:hypothetical protein
MQENPKRGHKSQRGYQERLKDPEEDPKRAREIRKKQKWRLYDACSRAPIMKGDYLSLQFSSSWAS